MFGPVNHAKLSRIPGGVLGDIYSIQPMSITERFSLTAHYMNQLKAWRMELAEFLDQPSPKAAPLILISQRQRNILNLAYWHMFTWYFAFSAAVMLYVYTIQHSKEPREVYGSYFTAAERCQQQILNAADTGSLTARYCLVLEELRIEDGNQPAVG
ncbi:hypothetical protein BDW62DRAFT_200824 [Aspergillus aurantiobrunneus]